MVDILIQKKLLILKADDLKKEPYKESRSSIFGKCSSERKILVFVSELSDGLNPDDFRIPGPKEWPGIAKKKFREYICGILFFIKKRLSQVP